MRSLTFASAVALLAACSTPEAPAPAEPETTPEAAKAEPAEPAGPPKHAALFKPLPEAMPSDANPLNDAKVALGKQLYFDTRLSKNHDISCNSCHMLDNYGVDGEPTSPGHKGQRGDRNSPTVYNAALHIAQFWDGRAATVEEQAKGPVLNPIEMAMADEATVVATLQSIPGYAEPFKAAFPDAEQPITYDNMANAIGAFERTLVTPSRFDAYLAGDVAALTDAEKKGLDTYVATGCTTCHMGVGVGGAMYMKLGLVHPYDDEDEGRKKVTGNDADAQVFKVPSLRNVTKTGPYFHDGSIATLDEAVKKMAWHQLGKELTDEQVGEIVAFLGSLEGTLDPEVIKAPELPESGPDTPAPDPS